MRNYTKSNCSESWLNRNIVYQVVDPTIKRINLKIAKQLVHDRTLAMGDLKDVLVLVVVNNAISVDKEAKKYYDTEEPYMNIRAIAMIMDNYIARMIGNLVFLLNKQLVPTVFFNNEEKALVWLHKFE